MKVDAHLKIPLGSYLEEIMHNKKALYGNKIVPRMV
jgi:hypothetical protein